MKKKLFERGSLCFAILLVAMVLGCAGNPASAPAPLVELPSIVSIPEANINLDTISSAPPGAPLQSLQRAFVAKSIVEEDGEFSKVISFGQKVIEDISQVLRDNLATLNSAKIPVSPTLFELEFPFDFREGVPNKVLKYDFSPFDYDGDGVPEACTGCTCPTGCAPNLTECPSVVPLVELQKVCFRVWIKTSPESSFKRIAAGYFDILSLPDKPETPANEENAGKGQYTIGGSGEASVGSGTGTGSLFARMVYDHRVPDDVLRLETQMANINKTLDEFGKVVFRTSTNALVNQVPIDDSGNPKRVKKTVKTTSEGFEASETGGAPRTSQLNYIGRFREDRDFWSGSFVDTENDNIVPTTCARIRTGNKVLNDICIDAGIDTSGEDFLPPPADISFPADFPVDPTF